MMRLALALAVLTAGAFAFDPASALDRLTGHGGPIHALAAEPDANTALSASFDNSVGAWDLSDGTVRWLEGHAAAVKAVIALPGQKAASAGDDFSVIIWDTAAGRPLHRLAGHRGSVAGLAVSADGTLLASAGWDGRIGVWDVATGEHRSWLEGHDGSVNAVAFLGEGRLVSASADGTIREWDVAAAREIRQLANHGFAVNVIAADPAAGWLAYGAVDGGTRVASLDDGRTLADLTLGRRPILAMALSPDGTRLAVGDGEGHVMVVDTADWRIAHDSKVSARGPVWALAFAGPHTVIAGGIDDMAALVPVTGAVEPLLGRSQREFLRNPDTMENGERQFRRKCSVCHTLTGDGARRAGPTLSNIFGRRAGVISGYNYSPVLTGSTIVWTPETLDALFEAGPEHYIPGSYMPMQRIISREDRADLIRYLQQHTVE